MTNLSKHRSASVAILVGSALGVLGSSGCSGKVTHAECTEMLDKYIEMTVARDGDIAKLSESAKAAATDMKRAVRKADPRYRQVHDQCETEVTRKEYRCAMGADSPERWESCIE